MILHLLNGTIFDSLIITQMEDCFPNENIYLIFSENQLEDISESCYKKRIFYQFNYQDLNFNSVNGIIIHALTVRKARFIKSLRLNVPIACSLWGSDFYNFLPALRRNLYGDLTKHYLIKEQNSPRLYYLLKDRIFFPVSGNYNLWKNVAKMSKIFSTIIPYEEKKVKKYFSPDSEYLQIPTYSLEKVVNINDYDKTISTKESFLKNILIGNSGNFTNNHLEILYFLKSLNIAEARINVPLTYGDNDYINYICQTGNHLFGANFNVLLNHLSNSEYSDFLNSINISIFNSYRQQGIGTIVQALWSGNKVFLSNKNVTLTYYSDMGLKIYSVEDHLFKTINEDLFEPLKREEVLSNRKILLKLYSREEVNSSIERFISNLKGRHVNN